jgi:hypothetical protein
VVAVRKTLTILLVLLAFALTAAPANRGAKRFRVEYHDPVRGAAGVYTLDVIFHYRPTASESARILRRELENAVATRPPRGDILASAWYSPTGAEIDEDLVTLPDGSQHLLYLGKLKKTITFNEYERRKPGR